MLAEADLRKMADSITALGLIHPIVLDAEGRVIDGRNRLAACLIAGVEPVTKTYDGDAIAYILASNERRDMTLPQKAAATALTLATNGGRKNGRWLRGSVPKGPGAEGNEKDTLRSLSNSWSTYMAEAGLVLDVDPALLRQVRDGQLALDAAVQQARAIKDAAVQATHEAQERLDQIATLPDDLRALVEAGQLTLEHAVRRAQLHPVYAARVASGSLTIDEAETLEARDTQEHREANQRNAGSYYFFFVRMVVCN